MPWRRAAARGGGVRVLLDHWASSHCRDYKETIARLTSMGAQWHLMLPVQPLHGRYQRLDLRNHRKLLVVDGRVGFVGSQNVIDRSYNKKKNISRGLKWQELMCRIEGPVVASIDLVFATDWYMESGEHLTAEPPQSPARVRGDLACQVIPSGPGYPVENNLQALPEPPCTAPETGSSSPARTSSRTTRCSVDCWRRRPAVCTWSCSSPRSVTRASCGTPSVPTTRAVDASEDLLLPRPVHPAREALQHRRRACVDRIQQHGHAVVRWNSEISMMVHSPTFVADMRAVERGYREISRRLTPRNGDRTEKGDRPGRARAAHVCPAVGRGGGERGPGSQYPAFIRDG